MGVVPGDRVILLANTASGGVNAVELQVRGIFQTTTKAYDDVALRVPIGIARTLARVEDAHLWVVLLDKTEHTKVMLDSLRERYPEASSGVSFVPWYDQADFYNKTVLLFSKQVSVVWTLIAVVVVLSISNTMIMSVLERTCVIGTLLALGFRRGAILRQFIGEGLALGVAGGVVGLVSGVALARLISAGGIPMPAPPGMAGGFTGEVLVTWRLAVEVVLFALGTSVFASFYPAWKASRLEIDDTKHHNRKNDAMW